jgi:hypothetical protein
VTRFLTGDHVAGDTPTFSRGAVVTWSLEQPLPGYLNETAVGSEMQRAFDTWTPACGVEFVQAAGGKGEIVVRFEGADDAEVRKNASFGRHFFTAKPNIYQDRLRTNIGKTPKTGTLSRRRATRPITSLMDLVALWRRRAHTFQTRADVAAAAVGVAEGQEEQQQRASTRFVSMRRRSGIFNVRTGRPLLLLLSSAASTCCPWRYTRSGTC